MTNAIPVSLKAVCSDYAERIHKLVQKRTSDIFVTIRDYISEQIKKAFTANELEQLTIQISLNPDYPLTKMEVLHSYPNNPCSTQNHHDVEFKQYTGDDKELTGGLIFRTKLTSALATRLTNELNFEALPDNSNRYKFTLDMSILRDGPLFEQQA